MITLSNGYKLDFCCSSGALGFDGNDSGHGIMKLFKKLFRWLRLLRPKEFTIITKTVTFKPRKGNLTLLSPWRCVRKIKGGYVNCVGLSNPGYMQWFADSYCTIKERGYKVIVSIFPENWHEASLMCQFFNEWHDLVGVQINLGCPNVAHSYKLENILDMLGMATEVSEHPILIKLGYQDDYVGLLKEIDRIGISIQAVELIDTVPWYIMYPDRPSPLAKYNLMGGVSGRPISSLARKALNDVKKAGVRIPVISGGGIYDYDELLIRSGLGADAFAIGTLFTSHPWLPNILINKYRSEYGDAGISTDKGTAS